MPVNSFPFLMQWGDIMAWCELAFQYDGTYEGFLCCIYESYIHKEFPIAFCDDEEFYTLYEVRVINTVPDHAKRIQQSIDNISKRASLIVRRTYLTCLPEKEQHLYRFVRRLYADGPDFIRNISDPVYYPIHRALRHMDGELEKLRGFVRFTDYNGFLGAEIEPKNRVLPLLRHHFCSRYANESFFIYDRTHKELLMHSAGHSRIAQVDTIHLNAPGDEEIFYRSLWKRFFETVSITQRENPRCQNTFLPKRYRGTMTEFLPVDAGTNTAKAVLENE